MRMPGRFPCMIRVGGSHGVYQNWAGQFRPCVGKGRVMHSGSPAASLGQNPSEIGSGWIVADLRVAIERMGIADVFRPHLQREILFLVARQM